MEHVLNTRRKLVVMKDPREERLADIRKALRNPAALTDKQLQELSVEMSELEYDLMKKEGSDG